MLFQFWRNPELVTQLISFLDISSTLAIATVLPLARELLQQKSIWGGMLKRYTSKIKDQKEQNCRKEEEKVEVGQILDILKLMKNPEHLLLDLLHSICERNCGVDKMKMDIIVTLSCAFHTDHIVDRETFELLEVAEGNMGTSMQQIKEISLHVPDACAIGQIGDNILGEMSARLHRQVEPLQMVKTDSISVDNQSFSASMLGNTMRWNIMIMDLKGSLGEEGWTWIAKGKQKNRDMANLIKVDKECIKKAKKEDLKALWDATDSDEGEWQIYINDPEYPEERLPKNWTEEVHGKTLECGWKRLEEIWIEGQK